jgi:hypothetical protein
MLVESGKPMQAFNLSSLVAESERDDQRWREFLRVPSLSMGLYRLEAGQADEQQPHTEDEVDFVISSGKASFRAGGRELAEGARTGPALIRTGPRPALNLVLPPLPPMRLLGGFRRTD